MNGSSHGRAIRPEILLLGLLTFAVPPLRAQVIPSTELPQAPQPQLPPAAIENTWSICQTQASTSAEARMCCSRAASPFVPSIYLEPPPLTASGKLDLAWQEFIDPFNLLTIAGEAMITTASDAHSAYGPGMKGFMRYAGVSASQNAVSNFFGVFLIPSLGHQNPHYFRDPNLPVSRRIAHIISSVVVGRADDGLPMFNYAQVFGTIGTSLLGNGYVPGRKTGPAATTARIAVALGTAPIGNAVTEFLPDVARHININVVLVQKVINRIAVSRPAAAGP